MEKTIYKYRLTVHENIKIPKGGIILSADRQNDEAYIWCLVDSENELEERKFNLYATGEIIDPCINQRFISTVLLWDSRLVYHIFEEIK